MKSYPVIDRLPHTQIIEEYNSGQSVISLAKRFKCGQGTIVRLLKRHNIKLRNIQESRGGVYISPNEILKIQQLYLTGTSKEQLCEMYKCSLSTLKAYLKKYKIKKHDYQLRTSFYELLKKNKGDVISLYKKYKSMTVISKKYNCSRYIIATFMDKEGIPRKNNVFNPIPLKDKNRLYNLHYKKMYTMEQIGKLYNCAPPTVAAFFDKHNIPRRTLSETAAMTAQNPNVIRKQKRSLFSFKNYILPSGRIIKLQGYEPYFLDYCFNNDIFKESDFDFDTIKRFKYVTNDNKVHYYFPDFYLP